MARRLLLVLVLLASPLAGACAAEDANGSSRAGNAQNPNPNPGGIGPGGNVGAAPRDMPGGGRGSTGPHGR